MAWPWEIVERDHEIQDPTSPKKIRLLGDYLRLGRNSRVLDLACGKGGPARILAGAFGCRVHGVELREAFVAEARARNAEAGLDHLVTVESGDAAAFALDPGGWDAVVCLGASFVWGHVGDAATALVGAVRPGGFLAIGEPYWRTWPLPESVDESDFVPLETTVERFTGAGLALTGLIASSEDDWDRYESLHWRAVEEWLAEEPDHSDAADVRAQHVRFRAEHLRRRTLLGWAILVGRAP